MAGEQLEGLSATSFLACAGETTGGSSPACVDFEGLHAAHYDYLQEYLEYRWFLEPVPMAESSRIQSFGSFFRNGADPALSPESYLEFSRRCLEEVQVKTWSPESKASEVINHYQCLRLVDQLGEAVHTASLFLERNRHQSENSISTEDVRESALEHFKILCMLAKKVKCFIQGCCNGHWLQAAVMLTNLSHCSASLGFDLKLFTVLFPSFSASPSTLSLYEVSAMRKNEGELVKKIALDDKHRLYNKLSALILYGQASNDDLELATFVQERLDRLKESLPSITPGSLGPILCERDLMNLKHMVQIGRGGHGTVHRASWLEIGVAVKTFYGTNNPDFKKEVQILASLSHPNIVSFLCHGKDMGKCFIVMELMDGDLLSLMEERLRSDRTRSSPFSAFEEFDVILQIAEAMDYLHEMRVLHRDLKSHNILVRCMKSRNAEGYEYVQVKVSDFGLSRTKEFSMTKSDMTPNMGTARWMAPELIKFQNTNDILDTGTAKNEELMKNYPFKCDVYSFGMVCLEILTGDVPFPSMTANEVKRAVCAGERPQLPDRCHRKLKRLIEKCWNPNASSRPCFGDICTELRYLKSLHMTRKPQGTWIRSFTIDDLRSMTGYFAESNLLGRDDCSVVHKGILADGSKVAVKRMMGAVTRLGLEFIELGVGGWMSPRHPHLVETLGCCIDGNDFLLVTKCLSQGTLIQRLVKYQESNPDKALLWKRKLMIAMDIAQALVYLHGFDWIFLYFDLKSSNVLLDDDLNAKVSGFGLMNCFADGSLPQGAGPSGYTSPECTRGGGQTEAAHVYSFGVVLMEVLTGRPAMSKKQALVTWFRKLSVPYFFTRNCQLAEDLRAESFCAMKKLAMDCTADNPDARPDMNHAVSVLRDLFRKEGLVSLADLVE